MRPIHLKALPGTNLKKLRIHWFVHDDAGPITTPKKDFKSNKGSVTMGGVSGHIACQPQKKGGLLEIRPDGIHVFMRTDSIRAATCPECLASAEAKVYLASMEDTVEQMI